MTFGADGIVPEIPYVKLKGTVLGTVTPFPKWKYHAADAPEGVIVDDAEEESALGAGWVDNPAQIGIETAPAQVKLPVAKKRGRPAKALDE